MEIKCSKRECLNNLSGKCSADVVHYDGRCQTYESVRYSMKGRYGIVKKTKGKYKRYDGEVLK